MSFAFSSTNTGPGVGLSAERNPNNDRFVAKLASGITGLRWGPEDRLAVATWTGDMELYNGATGAHIATYQHTAPMLGLAWSDNTMLGAHADGKIIQWEDGRKTIVGMHREPVRCISVHPEQPQVVWSASWDKSVCLWDLRAGPQSTATWMLNGKAFCMDHVNPNVAVVGTSAQSSESNVNIIDGRHGVNRATSALRYQLRSVARFTAGDGFALGGIEGRSAICCMSPDRTSIASQGTFAFKCHRLQQDIYGVNDIHFHPNGTFATVGADGTFNFWDKDRKQRLRQFNRLPLPLVAGQFSQRGDHFAYAASYDWHMGADDAEERKGNWVFVHTVAAEEVRPRPR